MYEHVFGPVPSRRLGISLGVDLVVSKSCNMDCVFCECGKTDVLTPIRKRFKDIKEVESEIKSVLKTVTPDYITFSGSGEPTLSLDLGKIIDWIKNNTDIKIAVITNSLLLNDDEVIDEIMKADLVIPTINSTNQDTFFKISRPLEDIKIVDFLSGIRKLCERFKGEIYLETFIIEEINDSEEELKSLAYFLRDLKYTRLQLNSLDRPGTETWIKPVSSKRLSEIKKTLESYGVKNIEVVSKIKEIEDKIEIQEDLYKNMISKRKYTPSEIEKIFKK